MRSEASQDILSSEYTPYVQQRHPCRFTIASPRLKQLVQKAKEANLYRVNLTDWYKKETLVIS